MKIAMVSIQPASFARAVDDLAGAVAAAGHEVRSYSLAADDGRLPRNGTPGSRESVEASAAQLVAEWSRAPPDVVHAHSWFAGMVAVQAARTGNIPVVATFHGLGRAQRRRTDDREAALRVEQETALTRAVARIIASSSPEVFGLLELGANPRAIKLIPRGVNLDVYAPAAGLPIRPREVFRAVTLSSLVPDAGVGDVIEALRYVDGVELHVGSTGSQSHDAADGSDAGALESLAATRGVGARVSFHANIGDDEVAAFLQSADVVICPARSDSVRSFALEAMACGVPVIVSAVGGHVDAVSDGITGTAVVPQAPRQLAYALESLKGNPVLRERFSRFGVERARARHGWPRIADETLEVYRIAAAGSMLTAAGQR